MSRICVSAPVLGLKSTPKIDNAEPFTFRRQRAPPHNQVATCIPAARDLNRSHRSLPLSGTRPSCDLQTLSPSAEGRRLCEAARQHRKRSASTLHAVRNTSTDREIKLRAARLRSLQVLCVYVTASPAQQ